MMPKQPKHSSLYELRCGLVCLFLLGIFFAGCGEDQPVGLANRTRRFRDRPGRGAPGHDPRRSRTRLKLRPRLTG
jgi:hypothetical protein